jgi:hypothetical protein
MRRAGSIARSGDTGISGGCSRLRIATPTRGGTMNQQDTTDISAIEVVAADTDIADQIEDDDPDEHGGDDVAYDLNSQTDPEGGA